MKKQLLSCACLFMTLLLLVTGCSSLPAVPDNSEAQSSAPVSSTPESSADSDSSEMQFYDGRIGDTLSTAFFDFTVDSVDLTDAVAAEEGMMVLDVVITVKNTFGEEIPMFYNDFQMQYGEGDYDCCYSLIEDTLPENTVPERYGLKRAETVSYHYYYPVPEDATEFAIAYLEVYEDDSTGDAFFIYFERQ